MSVLDRLTDPATMPGLSFEEQTYEVSRRLAAFDRRRFLGGSVALLAASAGISFPAQAQRKGGSLRIGRTSDPDTLDPTLSRTVASRQVFAALCDKLVDINEKLEIVPQLARRWRLLLSSAAT